MSAPALKRWSATSKSARAASIRTSAWRNRNVTMALSLVWSTTSTRPAPPMTPPAAVTSDTTRVIGWSSTVFSVTGTMRMLRISGNVHPVSS
jgi:hypothetical protein